MVDPSRGKPFPSSRCPDPARFLPGNSPPWKSYTLTELWKSDLTLYLSSRSSLSRLPITPRPLAPFLLRRGLPSLFPKRTSLLHHSSTSYGPRYRVSRQALIFPLTFTPSSFRPSLPPFSSPSISGNYTRTRTGSLKWRKNSRVSLQAIIRLPLSLLSRITFYPVQSSGAQ